MKTGTIVGLVLVVGAIGAGAYFFWPRKAAPMKTAPKGGGAKKDDNVIDQATSYVESLTGAAAAGNQLFDQINQLGGNLGSLFGGSKPAGAATSQGTADSPPIARA